MYNKCIINLIYFNRISHLFINVNHFIVKQLQTVTPAFLNELKSIIHLKNLLLLFSDSITIPHYYRINEPLTLLPHQLKSPKNYGFSGLL